MDLQNLVLKNYECSPCKDVEVHSSLPILNLYIQTTTRCNAKCNFCKLENAVEFNYNKLETVLDFLSQHKGFNLGKIALTGGEPLLEPEKVSKIIDIICKKIDNPYITLNTNGILLNSVFDVRNFDKVNEINLSVHHYDTSINNKVFGTNQSQNLDILNIIYEKFKTIITTNTTLCDDGINSIEDVQQLLNFIEQLPIKKLVLNGIIPLCHDNTIEYNNKIQSIMDSLPYIDKCKLYDKNICSCKEYGYVGKNGLIRIIVKHTKQSACEYIRQFVFAQNKLLAGFNGEILI